MKVTEPSSPTSGLIAASGCHCTLADTVDAAESVNVQVLVFCPPLEQAPDQMASRPLETRSVIELPIANDAEPAPPVETLMPAGVETTVSPLRPLAETVSTAVCGGGAAGVTVTVAVRVVPS